MSAKGGITKGKSHAEGGIPMVVKSTGQQVELEGGEGVINKRNMASTKTFDFEGKKMTICEIASKINSAEGNGVQIDCDNVTGTKYKYEKGGKILNEDEESEFKIWFEDGNVIEFEKGVYSTQDAQYSNKLKGMDELRKYFRKEFLSDSYSEGGNVNQELKMDYDFQSVLLPNEKQFFLQRETKAIENNNLIIFTDGKREIVFSRRKTKLKKLGNASKSTKELYDKYFADGGYVDLETYNFNELRGKYVNLYSMGVELPTENQIVDITLTSPQFRYRDLTLKFDLGNAKIKFDDIEDFLNEEIVYVKTDKEEFGVQLIPNQFAKGGEVKYIKHLIRYSDSNKFLHITPKGDIQWLKNEESAKQFQSISDAIEYIKENLDISKNKYKYDVYSTYKDKQGFLQAHYNYITQFAKGGRTKNAMKLDDYENASVSMDSYEDGAISSNPTEFAKGGFVVYAENEDGYYRKISEHDTMRGAKTKLNNVFDSGEYEKVGAISSQEWEKNYAPYQFQEGGLIEEIKRKYQTAGSDSSGVYTYSKRTADEIAIKYKGDVQEDGSKWYVSLKDEYAKGGGVNSQREYLEKRLWNERGYDYSYLNKLSVKELRSLYDTEFYYDEEFKQGGGVDLPKANKMFHLPLELAVYVPSTQDVDKVISDSELKERVDEVSEYLARLFGGFTKSDKIGGFMSSKSELVTEDVVPVVSFATKSDFNANKEKLVNKLSEWAKRWGQEAIGFEFEGDLYYVPEKFAKGGNINKENYGKMTKHKYDKGGRVKFYLNGFEESLNYILNSTNAKEVRREGSKEDGDLVIYFETTDEKYAEGGGIKHSYEITQEGNEFIVEFLKSNGELDWGRGGFSSREEAEKYALENRRYAKGGITEDDAISLNYIALMNGIRKSENTFEQFKRKLTEVIKRNDYRMPTSKAFEIAYEKNQFADGGLIEEIKRKYQTAGSDSRGVYTYSKRTADEIASKYNGDVQEDGSKWYVSIKNEYANGGGVNVSPFHAMDRYNKIRHYMLSLGFEVDDIQPTDNSVGISNGWVTFTKQNDKTEALYEIDYDDLLYYISNNGTREDIFEDSSLVDEDEYAKGGGVSDDKIKIKGFPPISKQEAILMNEDFEENFNSNIERYTKHLNSVHNTKLKVMDVKEVINFSKKLAKGGGVDGEKVFEAQEDGILGVYSGSDAYTIEISKGDRFKTFGKQDNGNWWFVKKINVKPISLMLENTFDYNQSKSNVPLEIWQDLVLTFPKGENSIYAEMKEVFANGGGVGDNYYRISISENDKYIGEYPHPIESLMDAKTIFVQLANQYKRPQYLISVSRRPTSSSGYEKINVNEWYDYVEGFAKGGDVRDMSWYQDFKKQELKRGTEHEMEHIESIKKFKKKGVSDREVAKAIAKDHLDENENYYIELDKMKESSAKVSNALQDFDHQKSKRKNSRKYKLGGYMGINEPVNVHIKLTKDHEAVVRSKDGTYLNDVNLKKNKIYKFGFLFDEGQNVAFDLGNGSDSYILIPSSMVVVVGYDEEKMELGGEVKSYAEYQLDRNDKSILKLLLKIDPFSATAEQRDKVSTFKGNNRVNDLSPKLIQKIYGILFQNHNVDNKIRNLYITNIGVGNILLYAPNYLEKTMVGFDEKNEFVQVEKEIANIVTLGKRATLFNEFELSDIDGFIHVYPKSNPEVDNLCEIFYKSKKKAVAVGVCEFTSREKLNEFQRSITINQGSMAQNQMISFAKANDYLIVNEGITSEGQYTLIYTMTKY